MDSVEKNLAKIVSELLKTVLVNKGCVYMSNTENIELPGALDFTFVCALSINLTMCSHKK